MDPIRPLTPPQEVRFKNGEQARLIRSVVAACLEMQEDQVTNSTTLEHTCYGVVDKLNTELHKDISMTAVSPNTTVAELTALYRDA